MARPHIQVLVAEELVPESLRAALQRVDATAGFGALADSLRHPASTRADAFVMVVPPDTEHLADPLRSFFERLAEHPRATLVLSRGPLSGPIEYPPTVPVSFCHDLNAGSLAVRLGMMLEMRQSLDSLHRGLLANRRSGESVAQRYHSQLRLASQLQREFLPESLPRMGRVSFDVLFRPVDYVSGDIYDVHRLDEHHIGIALADATGHGIPAALLTVYIKRALRGKAIDNGGYRILTPDEVLAGLNADILDADLPECPFVAALYAVLNTDTLELSLARAGAPYPIYRSGAGEVELIETVGGVVGVAPDTTFEVRRLQLEPGDSLLLYSDGLDRVIAPRPDAGYSGAMLPRRATRATSAAESESGIFGSGGTAVLTAPDVCDPVASSNWWTMLATEGAAAALQQVGQRQRALRRMGCPLDDLTVLLLQVQADGSDSSGFQTAGRE